MILSAHLQCDCHLLALCAQGEEDEEGDAPVGGGAPRYFSNSGRAPPVSRGSVSADDADEHMSAAHTPQSLQHLLSGGGGGDSDDADSDDDAGHAGLFSSFKQVIQAGGVGAASAKGKGAQGAAAARRPAQASTRAPIMDSSSESEDDGEADLIMPASLRVPTLANLAKIHAHVSQLLNPPAEQQSPNGRAATMQPGNAYSAAIRRTLTQSQSRTAMQMTFSPVKKRQLFVTEIIKKSAGQKKSNDESVRSTAASTRLWLNAAALLIQARIFRFV